MAELSVRRCRPLLGTFVEIAAPDGSEAVIAQTFARIADVHARMSFHEEASDLAALRRAPAGETVEVAPDTVAVLAIAADLHGRSAGLFDVTIGARLVATGFLPRPDGVDIRRFTGDATDIEILGPTSVRCARPLLIDLGGIAKGYAVDQAIEALVAAGIRSAIVNAGGDLCVLGEGAQRVHLRNADGAIVASLDLANAALATSSNRHARRVQRGRIETPHRDADRRAVISDQAVTVVADSCMIADAMTKVALADPGLARRMLSDLGGEMIELPALEAAA